MSKQAHEIGSLIGTIDPQSVTTAEVFTDVVDMDDWAKVQFIFQTGVAGNTDDLICRVVTCTSAGASAAAFKTGTTRAGHATNNDNGQEIIVVDQQELAGGGANANRYVKGGIVGMSDGTLASCAVIGMEPKHGPANDSDLASIWEIVTAKD